MTRLGFNTRVSFPTGQTERGLREGIVLFRAAETLGYQSGWACQRHFDNYLSSPIPFFAAAGQHTSRITLGSAVIPARYQEPILLAEAAGLTDQDVIDWIGPLDPARAVTIQQAYPLAFFDRHLRGRHSPLLTGPSPAFPEVRFIP